MFYNIDVIDEAIEQGRQIIFDYNMYGVDKKLNKTSTQTASPYQLILHNQHYYLMFLNEKYKTIGHYRVDKITNINITEAPVTPLRSIKGYESGIDYKKYSCALPYIFNDEITSITFECPKWVVDQVVDWFGKNIVVNQIAEKTCSVTVYSSLRAMEYWAMQYLKYVEIKSPQILRERIKNNLLAAQEKYKN